MSIKKANKAALYSALVFPGAGLLWLKHYGRACVFMVPSLVALVHLARTLYHSIAPVYLQMLSDAREGSVDVFDMSSLYVKLSQEIHQSIAAQQGQLHLAEVVLVAAWACSIVSSYFVGKKTDLDTNTTRQEFL